MNDASVAAIDSVQSLREFILHSDSVLVVGNRSKPVLSIGDDQTRRVSTRALSGILEYEPSEFTFTALSGTTLQEIREVLAQKNQYLPFDPMLIGQGATLGGTLASGISGPGRHRYGGVRDFVLGAEFIAGDGQLIRSGGKVVKNAAGFDIPKLLVGSCGTLGALTALTFKVFPRPVGLHTFQICCDDHETAARRIALIARGRWELDAIDYDAETRSIWIRLSGELPVCQSIAADIDQQLGGDLLNRLSSDQADQSWNSICELSFGGPSRGLIVKVPTVLDSMQRLARWCDEQPRSACLHASAAGAVGWLAVDDQRISDLDRVLQHLSLSGLVVRGNPHIGSRCRIGLHASTPIEAAVKRAMDPPNRFWNQLG